MPVITQEVSHGSFSFDMIDTVKMEQNVIDFHIYFKEASIILQGLATFLSVSQRSVMLPCRKHLLDLQPISHRANSSVLQWVSKTPRWFVTFYLALRYNLGGSLPFNYDASHYKAHENNSTEFDRS